MLDGVAFIIKWDKQVDSTTLKYQLLAFYPACQTIFT